MARKLKHDPSVYERKKIKRTRKPMSEEQRQAAIERLAKAREKRALTNPPQYKNVHPSVLERDEDDMLAFHKVRQWIKSQKEELAATRQEIRANVKGSIAKAASIQGYIKNMETYLRSGDWVDGYWGEHRQNKITWQCLAMAFNDDGSPKRNRNTYYPDIEKVWEGETEDELRAMGLNPAVGKVRLT
jgi:hypothetical protein